MLENEEYRQIIADSYFHALASEGLLLTNSFAVARPSEPNYLAMIGWWNGDGRQKVKVTMLRKVVPLLG